MTTSINLFSQLKQIMHIMGLCLVRQDAHHNQPAYAYLVAQCLQPQAQVEETYLVNKHLRSLCL